MANAFSDLASKVVRGMYREVLVRRGRILSATFSITYKCNLRCTTCGVWVRGETDDRTELSAAEIMQTCRQLRDLGVSQVNMVGSEPLFRRDTLDIIEAMRDLGLEVTLITNGTLLNEAKAERLVKTGLQTMIVSIDAVGERHDMIRGQAHAYKRTMDGLQLLAAIKKRLGSRRPRLAIHATISALNTDVLEEVSGLSDEFGYDVSFQLASETSRKEVASSLLDGQVVAGEEFIARDGSFMPDASGTRQLRAFLQKPGILKKHPSLAIPACMSDKDLQLGRFPVGKCNIVESQIMIDPYGEVTPCTHLESYSYGNVKTQPMREIWQSARRARLVDRLRTDLFPVCDKCCHHSWNQTPWQKSMLLLKALRT